MPYNPGVNDISGQLRAQGMMRGGEGLLAGLTGGINILQEKREEDKANIASIKAFDTLMKGFEGIAGQLDPKIQQAVQQYGMQINDTSLSNKQRALIAAQGMKGLAEVMKIGSDVKQQNAIAEQNRLVNQARIESELAQKKEAEFKTRVGGLEGMILNAGLDTSNPNVQAAAQQDPQAFSIALGNATKKANDATRKVPGENEGFVGEWTINPILGIKEFTRTILPGGVYVPGKTPAAAAPIEELMPDRGTPYETLATVAGGGVPAGENRNVIKDSPADLRLQAAATKAQDADAKTALRVKAEQELAKNAYNKINRSLYLVEDEGAGGAFSGGMVFEKVGNLSRPLSELRSNYKSLNAQALVREINNLRATSQTGATGTGQLSNQEGAKLESIVADISASNNEDVQARNLRVLAKFIEEKTGVPFVEDKSIYRTKIDEDVAKVKAEAKKRFSIDKVGS